MADLRLPVLSGVQLDLRDDDTGSDGVWLVLGSLKPEIGASRAVLLQSDDIAALVSWLAERVPGVQVQYGVQHMTYIDQTEFTDMDLADTNMPGTLKPLRSLDEAREAIWRMQPGRRVGSMRAVARAVLPWTTR